MRQTPLVASPTNVSSPPMALSRRAFLTVRKPRSTAAVAPGAPRDPFSPAASTGDPDGYWVRYLPSGYSMTRLEIWVPQGSPSVDKEFDPATHIAVPGNTSRQRLIQSGRAKTA